MNVLIAPNGAKIVVADEKKIPYTEHLIGKASIPYNEYHKKREEANKEYLVRRYGRQIEKANRPEVEVETIVSEEASAS